MRALIVILYLALSGCASVPSCSVGLSLLGPLPVPYVNCDVTLYEEEDEDREEEED